MDYFFLFSFLGSITDCTLLYFQYLLRRASLTENDAFAFLKADDDGDCITYSGFCKALRQVLCGVNERFRKTFMFCHLHEGFFRSLQLNLIGHCYGLSIQEIRDLWFQADIDRNGFLDYKEFQVIYFTRKFGPLMYASYEETSHANLE